MIKINLKYSQLEKDLNKSYITALSPKFLLAQDHIQQGLTFLKQYPQNIWIMVGSFVGVVILGAGFQFFSLKQIKYYDNKIEEMQTQVSNLNVEISSLLPYRSELNSYEQQKKAVSDRLEIVRQLLSIRSTPVTVLDVIGQSLPKRVWLKSIRLVLTNKSPLLKIEGQSYSNEEISDYVERLTESVFLEEVVLHGVSSQKAENNLLVKAFEISAKPKNQKS